ncbi:DUF554 domain-containing protein [Thermosediminibacter oceani]|uniref:DUF554 domain-containing protein n=1 Tax=Thermosediminibacter oceani (strain ATCC BAA-1034 / DSM 16646 / JW/IW-1228P) TaxID=555079 RepID=D9S1A0_THEOJ|nr:DUF554 domain-containing protein [Thermosediminibacter oceani]ADL08979.1 protein of unknown function DUF554 [Thermosediminibacter oceani DSM 16646]
MLGTIVNAAAIIAGAFAGNVLKGRFPENVRSTIMQGLSLVVMLIGLSMALETKNLLVVTLSIVTGAIAGEALRIEERLNFLGKNLEERFGNGDSDFTRAFVSASLIYCVGAMAIMGSIESGLTGDHRILFIKSILDGVSAVVFSSSMGIGVAFSAIPVFLYQGGITLAAVFIKSYLTDAIIAEMTAAGGLLIFGIGINMLEGRPRIKVGNLLPAIFTAVVITVFISRFPKL